MKPEYFMKLALEEARIGDAPYGAVIVKDNQVIIKAHNTVKTDNDPTAHAELNAIRRLTTRIKNSSLEGYTLYTNCEPCPMCTTVCVWAGISEIFFGASIQDLIEAGVSQINLPSEEIIAKGFKEIKVTKGLLKEESLQLFNP
ncbi:nucleoside deaminase [Coleofasciculus sp. FACHB-1120]|uniref:nucleoside deaminase n=1 Tax=Coleofasciculus sp. FACHB-1120 TaxID=2692783 RepID=UPI001687B7E9|nr:nucleoside deaminase [Coleofasciculus sp. FACHB-1120]MBD2742601.1 nucleoside deaminase [Coleofasciculus sp. FACHB-1120]